MVCYKLDGLMKSEFILTKTFVASLCAIFGLILISSNVAMYHLGEQHGKLSVSKETKVIPGTSEIRLDTVKFTKDLTINSDFVTILNSTIHTLTIYTTPDAPSNIMFSGDYFEGGGGIQHCVSEPKTELKIENNKFFGFDKFPWLMEAK